MLLRRVRRDPAIFDAGREQGHGSKRWTASIGVTDLSTSRERAYINRWTLRF
jgi:hypothetical protein